MNIQNQRIITKLVQDGNLISATAKQLDFEYGDNKSLEREADMLQTAGYFVVSKNNLMTVAD